jgi:hypothetical protein
MRDKEIYFEQDAGYHVSEWEELIRITEANTFDMGDVLVHS